ncbi:MAG: Holliday junction branch migration protein RuvA [Solirubrobacteraceae bacterium]
MIALLRGEVALRRADHVVVLCGGVGYRLAVSSHTLAHVPAVGAQITLHTQLIVRDDALVLYGFHSEQERELFLMLLAVQSVGPKVAVAVLSGGAPRDLLGAIAAGDASRFQAVPGIGKRTAERIIVELRDKVGAAGTPALATFDGDRPSDFDDPRVLARDGLVELGFAHVEAERLLDQADGASAEELLAGALRAARASSDGGAR